MRPNPLSVIYKPFRAPYFLEATMSLIRRITSSAAWSMFLYCPYPIFSIISVNNDSTSGFEDQAFNGLPAFFKE